MPGRQSPPLASEWPYSAAPLSLRPLLLLPQVSDIDLKAPGRVEALIHRASYRDLRYGIRQLRRNPGFTAVAVLALALGIGVNTAVFTAYKTMVVRSLDASDPGEMLNFALLRTSGTGDFLFSYPDNEAFRDSLHAFRGLIAFRPQRMRFSDAVTNVDESLCLEP